MTTLEEIYERTEEKMGKAVEATQKELSILRTGRPNPSVLDRVLVDYYGTPTPVRQMANVSVVEGTTILIQPYDKGQLGDIDKAISKSELGLTPANDGSVIRIVVPPLSEERRKEIVKLVKKYGEDGKVAIRNVRRDAATDIQKLEKASELSEDEARSAMDDLQKMTDKQTKAVDELVSNKEQELMTV